MRTTIRAVTALVAGVLVGGSPVAAIAAAPPTREEVAREMGRRSEGDLLRGQRDTVGFVVTAEQAEDVVDRAVSLEAATLREQDLRLGMNAGSGFLGGVCPHDDHLYAARVYVPLTERITAPRVVLIGVFHRARLWNLENRLVFDSFRAWHGPWGPVAVDPLREELLRSLPGTDVVVDNAMHEMEHSLEAIVPFLQHRDRDVSIVPILAPFMTWDRLTVLSNHLADALAAALERNHWKLGRDVAVVVSSDAVHYGDDFEHVPFGSDAAAYSRAEARDREIAERFLAGPLEASRLEGLLHTLVDESDLRRYRLPWCGRFSIPFGLEVLRKTAARVGEPMPVGHVLRYGTSLSEPELPVGRETRDAGLGYTAPSNLHHWVGYAAIGYLPTSESARDARAESELPARDGP
jgi:AmmeMemoRadiSam system protein B